MNIVMPMDNLEEIEALVQAGANELYCSVTDKTWAKDYTYLATSSRRNSDWSILSSFDDLKAAVKKANSFGARVLMASNELTYTQDQYPLLIESLKQGAEAGVDAFIMADFGLMLQMAELDLGVELHISLGGAAFNRRSVDFFRDLGATRIILPQDLTVREMRQMVEACEGMEFEAFILNAKCSNTSAYCNFSHDVPTMKGSEGQPKKFDLPCYHDVAVDEISGAAPAAPRACGSQMGGGPALAIIAPPKKSEGLQLPALGAIMKSDYRRDRSLLKTHCGACYLRDFQEMGVNHIKIVGRGFPLPKKLKDLEFIGNVLNYSKEDAENEAFYFKVRGEFAETYASPCQDYCYYTNA